MENETRTEQSRLKDKMDDITLNEIKVSIAVIEGDIKHIKNDLSKDVEKNKEDICKVKDVAYDNKDRINKYYYMSIGYFGLFGSVFTILKLLKVF